MLDSANQSAVTLEAVPLLRSLAAPELHALAAELHSASFRPGTVIFDHGDPGSTLYIISTGQVKISVDTAEGREVTLAILEAGEFFGELSLLDDLPRSATATALTQTEVVLLSRARFLATVKSHPPIAREVLATLGRRLRHADTLIEDIVQKDAPTRVARQLLALAAEHGMPTGEGVEVRIPLTQQELAAMAGVTRETMNKVLRAYLVKGWISYEGRRLTVRRRDLLLRRSS
jgi:CRP-like cAMP-binding protein